jgi:hypothetical protein
MCKELLVNLVKRVVDNKRKIGKMEGQGGGKAQGVADPPPPEKNWREPLPCRLGHWLANSGCDF